MRVRLDTVDLIGSSRRIEFSSGLNIISGPITTGKTKLLDLCGALLGLKIDRPTPELSAVVSAVAGRVILGDARFTIVRPLVTTSTAPVDVAGDGVAARLPAMQPDGQRPSYGQWLLEALDLPRISVPRAPTQPDSDPTPVSVSDYLSYCVLHQDEIDSSVFGHRDPFKNIKRKYVFEILYGLYDVRMAELHERVRSLSSEIRFLQNDESTLSRILADTEWSSRSELTLKLEEAGRALESLRGIAASHARDAAVSPRSEDLRNEILGLDRSIAEGRDRAVREATSISRFRELVAQLEAQSGRLTRSIVAEDLLVDFEFRTCPRCGASVSQDRGAEMTCMLCLQEPVPSASKRDLIEEQNRVETQAAETRQLITDRESGLASLNLQIEAMRERRASLGADLDAELSAFVSDHATAIRDTAAREARQQETIVRLRDYLRLFGKLDSARERLAMLLRERQELDAELETHSSNRSMAQQRINSLDEAFRANLERLHVPEIGEVGLSYIDRTTYLPVVNGRSFDNLSSLGLKVLVNIAHTLAHQEVAASDPQGKLPGILLIDGPTSNIGHEGTDRERVDSIYRYLIEVGERLGDRVQLIVADNDVPDFAEPHVRVRFTDTNRLIPLSDLEAARNQASR